MDNSGQRWQEVYTRTPLREAPMHFANACSSAFLVNYFKTVLRCSMDGGRTLETGIGSGFGAIWLSLRGVRAEAIDIAIGIVERAKQVNNLLSGNAHFRVGDIFSLFREDAPRYDVIHHQGLLEHFGARHVQAILAQQVAMANWVVFSVPSVYYPFDGEFGDERLLTLEVWQHMLEPFVVEELRYYGDPALGGREHILCVLQGQEVTDDLRALMTVPAKPYPTGITALVLARNEERHLPDCLGTLKAGGVDQIVLIDMESTDGTAEIAEKFADVVVPYPNLNTGNFDAARNCGIPYAKFSHVIVVDADERAPAGLISKLREMTEKNGSDFEAVMLPFRHFFAGHFMQCLYPGYTAPRFFKNGAFVFQPRLHAGVKVDGRIIMFPADNSDLAIAHYSFDSLSHYLTKLDRYTTGESNSMHRDGKPFHWQRAIEHFVGDMKGYYDHQRAWQDGVHGFMYSFLSGFYRMEQHFKLFERRFQNQQLQPFETAVPASVEEMLEYALAVARHKPRPQPAPIRMAEKDDKDAADAIWSGPLLDQSGYGDESRNFLLALESADVNIAGHCIRWNDDEPELAATQIEQLTQLCSRAAHSGFTLIVQNFGVRFERDPRAGLMIGRTMFETDRLPVDWVEACNRMDYVWVPSSFNVETFANAGVAREKLRSIPGCLDANEFATPIASTPLVDELHTGCDFLFLTAFDWTLHKGWDVLLRGFLQAFPPGSGVKLALKVWSTNGYSYDQIKQQAVEFVKRVMGIDLETDSRVQFVFERLSRSDLLALYWGCDAFVLATRGEGWGRPFMEAMACGKPTIGTNWSGNTAFMNAENSYLVDYTVAPVPESGWREIPTYKGHRWAEPNLESLCAQMQRVVAGREEAKAIGSFAREHVRTNFSREKVAAQMVAELARPKEISRQDAKTQKGAKGEEVSHKGTKTRRKAMQENTIPAAAADRKSKVESRKYAIRWEGAICVWHSLGHVNREFLLELMARGVEASLVPTEVDEFDPGRFPRTRPMVGRAFVPLSQPADVHVRHFFPPRFERPEQGHLVLIQPWEYGYLPKEWIDPILENVREVWCYSEYVRQVYLASGIPADRLQVVPLGVDAKMFRPAHSELGDAPPYVFTDEPGAADLPGGMENRFVFLFVGGTLHRKGIDILLEAYQKAFSAYDDVVLVIKDICTKTVYQGQNERERILGMAGDRSRPAVVYLDADLTSEQLAGLYRSAHCGVFPYRGEGFNLPALECLSFAVPVIVPIGGPTDDFVDASVGYPVPAEKRPYGKSKVGPWECVGSTWQFEVSPEVLGKQMRQVFQNREEAKRRGEAGRKRVVGENGAGAWTWEHACDVVMARLDALHGMPALPTKSVPVMRAIPTPDLPAKKPLPRLSGKFAGKTPAQGRDLRASAKFVPVKRRVPTISLCMIVKNEERCFDACLQSIKEYVDEIIVVDTGSTDKTVEIAKKHGAKTYFREWDDDFSAARNESLKHATCDWVLWMDADDTIDRQCGKELRELIMMAETTTTGFIMQVHIPPNKGDYGFTIVDHVKVFRNKPEHRFVGRIHEQILEPIQKAGGTIQRSPLYVVHSGYDYSTEGQKRKRERDLRIIQLDIDERPDHPFPRFNMGMTRHHLKEFDPAIEALEKSLSLSKPHESTVRKIYAMLGSCHLERGELQQSKARIEEGLALTPRDPELLFRAGSTYRAIGDLAAAERSYLELLNGHETGHIDSMDVSLTGFKGHHNLALLYQDMQRYGDAETHWKKAISQSPQFMPSWEALIALFLMLRRFEDVRTAAGQIAEWAPEYAAELLKRI